MGYGDKLMAIGDAWAQYQADPEKRKVAIGNGESLDATDMDLCWGLDFLANEADLKNGEPHTWVISAPSMRPYIDYEAMRAQLADPDVKQKKLVGNLGRYIWKDDYRAKPAPIRLSATERQLVKTRREEPGRPRILIEPYIKRRAPPAKAWPVQRFATVAHGLLKRGYRVEQISAPGHQPLYNLPQVRPTSFRMAMAYLASSDLYIGPEGGLHHAAAAMGTPAVVLFGSYIGPHTTGYDIHTNLTGGATHFCGTRNGVCPHCQHHMEQITAGQVIEAAVKRLGR